MIAFDAYNAPRIIYGEGVSKKVSDLLTSLGVKTVMAVYDEGIKKVGIADAVLTPIREAGFVVEEFGGVTADPPVEMIEKAANLADEKNVDIYVAIGGGGVIDTTKYASQGLREGRCENVSIRRLSGPCADGWLAQGPDGFHRHGCPFSRCGGLSGGTPQ